MISKLKAGWQILKQAAFDFNDDDAMTMGGALAFYTALSLAPLLIILIYLGSFLGPQTQQQLVAQIQSLVGPQAAEGVRMVIANASSSPNASTVAGALGLAILLFSASGVFAQLQASMNRIWDLTAAPSAGVWNWVRKRLLSFAMVLAIGFILLVSLAVSAALAILVPAGGAIWQTVNFLVSVGVFILAFALMYKFLPDLYIPWHYVWSGAILTAALFALGKHLIGLYLGQSTFASAYGAAGSLIVLLLWVYYSSLIVFFGAELTQAYARYTRARLRPNEHAVWAPTAPEARHPGEKPPEPQAQRHPGEQAAAPPDRAPPHPAPRDRYTTR